MNINTKGEDMAIPQVTLLTADKVQIRFTFQPCGFFTACLVSTSATDSLTIISDTARIHASSSSRFEIFCEKVVFDFPHTELKKFKTFLDEVNALKAAA